MESPKPRVAIYDTETDGLLPELTKIHCLAIEWGDGACEDFADQPGHRSMAEGLASLATADVRVAHNGQDFDEEAIHKVYPLWQPKPGSAMIDTLLLSRLVFPDIYKDGPNSHKLPPGERARHTLKAWGQRLGEFKGDYHGGWEKWSPEMHSYMVQDVTVLGKMFRYLMAQKPSRASSALEHEFAAIIRRMERRGFGFDMDGALKLLATLTDREQRLEASLIKSFGEWWEHGKPADSKAEKLRPATPAQDDEDETEEQTLEKAAFFEQKMAWGDVVTVRKTRNVKMVGFPDVTHPRFNAKGVRLAKDYVGPPLCNFEEGASFTPIKRVQFNPGSRAHVRKMLFQRYNWKPAKFTKKGAPVIDDDVLMGLTEYPEAGKLASYYTVLKRLGQLSQGPKAWMKCAVEKPQGIFSIHGRVNTNGAVTGRCTHSSPNIAQVPKNTAEYGHDCRALFIARPGYDLVGFDGSSLELRLLAHYVWPYDDGEYAHIVVNSKPHAWLRDLIGTDLMGAGDVGYDHAKTLIYAYLYGAGDEKLGSIIEPSSSSARKKALGAEVRAKLLGRFKALTKLNSAISHTVEGKGFLVGLDGRVLRVRKAHAALNTLLQSAGAIVMKKSKVVLDQSLRGDASLTAGRDYEFVANIHDEAQAEVLPSVTPTYSRYATLCVTEAGLALRVKTPMAAEVKVGHSWAETH